VRWSLSTKIFLGFAIVIFAFGSVALYGIYRMHDLRRNIQLVRRGVVPLTADLAAVLRDLKVYEEELSRTSQRDLVRLRSYFPNFKPFVGIERAGKRIATIERRFKLEAREKAFLSKLNRRLVDLQSATGLRTSLETSTNGVIKNVLFEAPEALTNVDLYDALARAFVAQLHAERFGRARVLAEELANIIRSVRNDVASVRRNATAFMAEVNRNGESSEAQTQLVISVAAGIALVCALGIMLWVGYTIRPLRRLREGARRVAVGDFTAVDVDTTDEIGQLADEFNRMAVSLAERDRKLETQAQDLLRAERLATIGKMSSQITHEIRNPLHSMGLNTELLEEELEQLSCEDKEGFAEAGQLLGAVRSEIDRLTAVTDQYLRFARLPKPELADADLNGLVRELLDFTKEELSTHDVRLISELDEAVPPLSLDANQIRQSLLNLVRNSMEAMTEGGDLRVTTRMNGGSAVLEVADTGPGIEPETLPRIFDPFFSTKDTGTGLGLPLVQQIIHEHGGTITCDSTLGQGTTFRIELPA